MKVCHVIHDLRRGGAEHLLVDLAGVAAGVGMEMSVVSLMPTEGHGYAAALHRAGVPVRSLELRTRWDPRAAGKLAEVLENLRPDLVHTHLKHADMVGSRATARLGIPMVSSLHVVEDAVGLTGRLTRRLALRARDRSAVRILAVSEALRRWYLSLSDRDPNTVLVLRNGVPAPPQFPVTHRSAVRTSLGVPEESLMAVTVVVLRAGKGIDDLLQAAAEMPADPDVRFVIAGSGPEEARLHAAAERLGLMGERVVFPGFVEDVAGLLAAADLLVHPSHADALATALIHGMAAGLPAVATDVGGTREIVDHRHGIIVPAGDAAALGEAVSRLAADPEQRNAMSAAARRRFAEEFDIEVWAARLRGVYDEVLAAER
ncbi:MAG: glycosyltransferase [Acidimicrobiia bacterium]|nr:glycosyltransferase [Acidimicrobiia bacterium]